MKRSIITGFILIVAFITHAADSQIILGRPEDREITIRIIPPLQAAVCIEYGTAPGNYSMRSITIQASREKPADIVLKDLKPSTEYFYRLAEQTSSGKSYSPGYSFRTARAGGESFSFVIQADSHLLNKADKTIYMQVMESMNALDPDLFFDLGDTFLVDKDPEIAFAEVNDIYYQQLEYLSVPARNAPLFLVIGNHEGEYGFLMDGTAENMAVYSALSRTQYYPNPLPDSFYSGNGDPDPFTGLPQDYYAFTWGDVLFVALDPYRYTMSDPSVTRDQWDWTLGSAQYSWLKDTLEKSNARFKLVFSHHMIGNSRGGIELAGLYEWGGIDQRGKDQFADKRPGWEMPIHDLFVKTGVTVFFQGHDHIFARETLDGVVYQTLPKPAELIPDQQENSQYFPNAAIQINSGFLNVTVFPDSLQVDYHRMVVAGDPDSDSTGIVHSYRIMNDGRLEVLKTTDDSAAFMNYIESGRNDTAKDAVKNEAAKSSNAGKNNTSDEGDILDSLEDIYRKPMLSCPGNDSVTVSVFAESGSGFFVRYGTDPQKPDRQTGTVTAGSSGMKSLELSGLEPGMEYYYRIVWIDRAGQTESEFYSFRTAKRKDQSFSFLVEADPHFDESTGALTYRGMLESMSREQADFIVDLGDSSMAEKLASDESEVTERYTLLRSFWDDIGHSLPFYMVIGNHDGEHGWKSPRGKTESPVNAGIRRSFLMNPLPDDFYSGLTDFVYSWEWGNALFVVLDPYAWTTDKSSLDLWNWTLGSRQYEWLKATLENSDADYKFVFIHNLVGGLGKDNRGGADAAVLYEWGGNDGNGNYQFGKKRPGWEMPVHDLLVKNDVDIVFHGHDHFFAREELDGVIYQLVPQPGFAGRQNADAMAEEYGYTDGVFISSPGYLKIDVSASGCTVSLRNTNKEEAAYSYTVKP